MEDTSMKQFLLPLLLIPCAALAAEVQSTTCTLNDQQRIIELETGAEGCQVRYTKGADTKTLWSSPRSEYCAPHAAAFIEKQQSWGFQCENKAAAESTAAAPAQ
jgi:hypothetical protein